MKTILKSSIVALAFGLASTIGANSLLNSSVSAQVSDACKAVATGPLVISGNRISAQFVIPDGCPAQAVTLQVYKTTAQILPVSTQRYLQSSGSRSVCRISAGWRRRTGSST